VKSYRLIGYENRMLAKEDFNNDKKDAGELGAGHTVTALYEIVPGAGSVELPAVDSLKYQHMAVKSDAFGTDELLTVKLRYKMPSDTTSQLLTHPVSDQNETADEASNNFKFASAVAQFGMLMRDSKFKGDATYNQVLEEARKAKGEDMEGYRAEFIQLVEKAILMQKQDQK